MKLHDVTSEKKRESVQNYIHTERGTFNLKFGLGMISFYGAQGYGPVAEHTYE